MRRSKSWMWIWSIAMFAVALAPLAADGGAEPADRAAAPWRQPTALVLSQDNRWLYTANRRSASLSAVDLQTHQAVDCCRIGGQPEAMARLSDGRLAIADGEGNRLVVLRMQGSEVLERSESPAGDEPRQLVASRKRGVVWASLRSECALQAFDLDSSRELYRTPLDFPPHCLALSEDETVVLAADAYRGGIASVDAESGRVLAARTFPGTNIRGLAFEPGSASFVFAHQIISERSIIDRELVRWGAFITNNVRRVRMEVLLDREADVVLASDLHFVGDFGHGAGDPGRLVLPSDDTAILCLSGVNEVGLDTHWPYRMTRVRVGRRPVDAVVDREGARAYVANQFDDSISVVDLKRREVAATIALGPRPAETAAMRGEVHFHDASLSLDNWYSCHTCHTDGHTNGSNADTSADGRDGAPKNTPSLLGAAATRPWSWTGRFDRLEEQIANTLEHTMQSRASSGSRTADLAAYLATLEPRPPRGTDPEERNLAEAGRIVFEQRGCNDCHAGPLLTSEDSFDVGLDDGIAGNTRFNPPSLRGVGRTAPYFHDGRAKSLEEVLRAHPPEAPPLTGSEAERLLAYLRSL